MLVVDVDQAARAALGGEQGGLGREVVLEVGVEVEVVAAEVGEDGDVEDDAVDPAHAPARGWRPPSRRRPPTRSLIIANRPCRSGASGVVSAVLIVLAVDAGADGADRRPTGTPARCRALSASRVVVVLPWVPVTPSIRSDRAGLAVHVGREAAEQRARCRRPRGRARPPGALAGAGGVGEHGDRAGLDGRAGVVDAVGAAARAGRRRRRRAAPAARRG